MNYLVDKVQPRNDQNEYYADENNEYAFYPKNNDQEVKKMFKSYFEKLSPNIYVEVM